LEKEGKSGEFNMDLLMEHPPLIFILSLLLLSIALTINTFIEYKKKKYKQLYYSYGWLIVSISILLEIIKYIGTMILLIIPKNIVTMVICNIILIVTAITGGLIVLKGRALERNK
jgi:uncharacterized membrane protein